MRVEAACRAEMTRNFNQTCGSYLEFLAYSQITDFLRETMQKLCAMGMVKGIRPRSNWVAEINVVMLYEMERCLSWELALEKAWLRTQQLQIAESLRYMS